MSYSVDVNLLLYASSRGNRHHEAAGAFLDRCRSETTVCCLTWTTLMSYLRMVTHPAIVSPPLTPERAMGNVEALLALPHVRVLSEAEGFWDVYREVTRGVVPRGRLVPDAHLAALLKQHGVDVLYTNDRDFLRFPFLTVRDPLA